MKSKITARLLSIFLGGLGIDRFYLGYTGLGVLKLFTGGCFGILSLIDIINIATGRLQPADGSSYYDGAPSTSYAPASTQVQTTSDPFDELEKLAKLHAEGALTDEEFAKAKSKQLAKI